MCIRPALSLHPFHHGDLLQQLGNHLSLSFPYTALSCPSALITHPLSDSPPPPPSLSLSIPQTSELIRALQELENAASGDSVLRQRISSLPAEVQDASLLHRITGGRRSARVR